MLTRRAATKRICAVDGKYEFHSMDSLVEEGIKGKVLPNKRDVLQRMLHEDNWRTEKAALL